MAKPYYRSTFDCNGLQARTRQILPRHLDDVVPTYVMKDDHAPDYRLVTGAKNVFHHICNSKIKEFLESEGEHK